MQAFLPILDKFQKNTGITVSYSNVRQEDLRPLLLTQFPAHRAPADLIFMVSSFIREHGPTGDAVDVTDHVNPANFAVGATQGTQLLSPVTNASKIYGGIYTGKVKPGFWYRQSFFTQHSLSPPTTWAQFQSLLSDIGNISGVSAPILAGDGVGWPLSDVTEHFIATYGGAAMHQALAQRTLAWTDAKVQAVFQNYLVPTLQNGFWTQPLTWNDPAVLASWWGGTTPPTHPLYFMGRWITGMVPNPNDLRV